MLDTTTKKNIDNCRDVLVGIVPDPKSQIEQITLALIYKFMDDMDKEAVEKFKGKAKFFLGEYAKFSWRKLFDPALGGMEVVKLYSDAIESFESNPNIPSIFREIFKNGSSALRKNAPTLKLFLKHINVFEYSHSEKLGDAFEYLLSVMGSQGDAGQFRTPRHIIDFVTACVNPQKNETVLDPACGTAGFLLSAYKHILNNSIKNDELRITNDANVIRNSKFVIGLSPDERRKLGQNIVGYDISPDMVRLSLANMYLHGFATPLIHEYDSLSSEDRWQETFDVILANPPFMTPKGGIRPHKKFGVQANKAEVLFTDYIAEHLNPNGRAGIVVPNGIVATSQTAYKQLRKMLVNDSLLAVISLPAGVFQPYSGVKTSVLILDKKLAKKSKHILFLKIENDGFDLGAQRRAIDKNDLPLALEKLQQFKEALINEKTIDEIKFIMQNPNDSNDYRINDVKDNTTPKGSNNLQTFDARNIKSLRDSLATLVEKETVLGNKDVVLSAERYFETVKSQTEFELVKLGDEKYFKIESGGTPSSEVTEYWNGNIRWATLKDLPASDFITIINDTERKITELGLAKSSAKMLPSNSILVSSRATIGRIAINKIPVASNQGFKNIVIQDFDKATPEYVALILTEKVEEMNEMSSGSTFKEISKTSFSEIEIPLPPLSIQQQIVSEIEGYQKIIDGAKQIVKNYKPTISINPDWEMVELVEVCVPKIGVKAGPFGSSIKKSDYTKSGYKVYGQEQVIAGDISIGDYFISEEKYQQLKSCDVLPNDVLISLVGTIGKSLVVPSNAPKGVINPRLLRIRPTEMLMPSFLRLCLIQDFSKDFFKRESSGGTMDVLSGSILKRLMIPLPSLSEQDEIVQSIEEEQTLVNGNKKLIALFEQKIKNKINAVWGVKEDVVIA